MKLFLNVDMASKMQLFEEIKQIQGVNKLVKFQKVITFYLQNILNRVSLLSH